METNRFISKKKILALLELIEHLRPQLEVHIKNRP